ncbi:E3 ubiquitin-protein ligase SGR9, amyloplastic [Linum perenne]
MSSLSTLTPQSLTNLTSSILSLTNHRRRRLSTLLTSPTAFSITLRHLHSLSISQKTHLISKHLLSSLNLITSHFPLPPPPPPPSSTHRDLDAALLLLHICDLLHRHPDVLDTTPYEDWRLALNAHFADVMLTSATIGVYYGGVLVPFVELVVRCWRFVVVGEGCGETAADAAAVVGLPSVSGGGGGECVVCKEEMEEGREVCEMPCGHLFHWGCILPWLRDRSTCPTCRFQLPTEDVHGEIRRLWGFLVKVGSGGDSA